MRPEVLHSPSELIAYRNGLGAARVGFVPTMGALHEGHTHLLRKMRAACDRLVLSIFVNPTQFGPNEDLAKYPRTLEADLELARAEKCDAVFFPTPEQIYPPGYSTFVEETALSLPLCGKFRPGHFRGVTTVVLKLFQLVRPHAAYFGLKDAQQFFVLHKMARDLELGISVEGVATVREPSGLALSSRNRYLPESSLATAAELYANLRRTSQALAQGREIQTTLQAARAELERLGFKVQYLELLELPQLGLPDRTLHPARPYLLAVAAHLGTTRLIDNVIVRPELLREHGITVHL